MKKPITPNSQIRAALRKLWLRSRERSQTMKDCGYSCQKCGVKQSKATGREVFVEVHHKAGVCNWEEIFSVVKKHLLCDPAGMEVLCKDCHKVGHEEKGG